MKMNSTTTLAAALAATWTFFACGAGAMELTISAGDQPRPAGPMFFKPRPRLQEKATYLLTGPDGKTTPAQVDNEGRLWWWAEAMKAGQSMTCELKKAPLAPAAAKAVKVERVEDGLINVTIDGKLFTAFNCKNTEPKPYLYPVIGPTGEPVTRDYPMKDNPLEKNNKRQDHPHHRSIYCAHGDIRTNDFGKPGANYWHEADSADQQDREKVTRIARMVSGPVFGQIEAELEWVTAGGQRQFTEQRTYTFFCGNDNNRLIDVRNVFKFPDLDAMFADTKEGGLLSVRLAVTMDESGVQEPERMHGRMTNANGQVGEKECWGRAAAWCDYLGPVKGRTVGVAVFDHPTNFRHPTRWHIRGYGLYTANPFGLRSFTRDNGQNGSHTWKKGETAEFNYRILIHREDTKSARVADHWKLYSDPPEVTGQ